MFRTGSSFFQCSIAACVIALTLGGCATGAGGPIPSSATAPDAMTPGERHFRAAKAWHPTLVVANQNGDQGSVLVFADAGKTLKRMLNVGDVVYGLTADNDGNLFVGSGNSDFRGNQVLGAYKKSGAKLAQTLKQNRPFENPTLDSSRNLYVICNARSVCEYQATKKTLLKKGIVRRLTIYANSPLALAADRTGDIAVMQGLEVDVYAPGATTPFWVVSDHELQGGMAFDSAGNLYVASGERETGLSTISEYAPGQTSPTRVLSDPEGPLATILQTDAENNLYAFTPTCSKCSPPAIAVFSPNVSVPTRVITVGNREL